MIRQTQGRAFYLTSDRYSINRKMPRKTENREMFQTGKKPKPKKLKLCGTQRQRELRWNRHCYPGQEEENAIWKAVSYKC